MDLDGPIGIIGAAAHPHAARRLGAALPDLVPVEEAPPRAAGSSPSIELVADGSLLEGAYQLAAGGGRLIVRGGPTSGVIHGVERVVRELAGYGASTVASTLVVLPRGTPAGVRALTDRLRSGPISEAPALPYRVLWTWDHSTEWALDASGAQDTGAFNPYNRQPETFQADFERLVDFASRMGIAALIVYGLLRDSHGGVETARRLCRYATERGVRILAGVGINAYGGIYWEGEHRYNLATWLRAHPGLAAVADQALGFSLPDYGELSFPRSDYLAVACPSRPENTRFHEEAIAWLVEELDVGGVNFEAGDYGGCGCDVCARDRGTVDRAARIADQYARLFDLVARSSRAVPRWSVYEVYTDNLLDEATRSAVRALPDTAAYQYTVNRSYWPRVVEAVASDSFGRLPHWETVLRTHAGSQWNRQRHAWVGPLVAEMALVATTVRMRGLTIFGEASAYHPPNELNYAAFARYTWDPRLDRERFRREEVDPRLGGEEAATRFLALLDQAAAAGDDYPSVAGLDAARDEARSAGAAFSGDVARRWLWLEERLARRSYAAGHSAEQASALGGG